MWTTITRLWHRLPRLRPGNRGSASADNVIWIAFLAATALTVTALFGPKILDAANGVVFK